MEQQAVEARKRIVSGDAIVDGSADQQAAAEPYPVMQSYLHDDTNRLGFATAAQRNYHFASHISGSVATLAELEAEWNDSEADRDDAEVADDARETEEASEADRSMRIAMSEKEGRVLTLDVHRATDHAATVAAVVAFLKEQGLRDFELRYVVSTGELE
jgi:hypothetical protein